VRDLALTKGADLFGGRVLTVAQPYPGAELFAVALVGNADDLHVPEPAMIDLYAIGSPNVVKIYIALEEMELPYTAHPVDVFGEEQFKPESLKLNPNAKVPVITDDDGPGGKPYTLLESGAILLYLAEKNRPVPAQGPGRAV